ncbi:MAG: RluA family pseudouridine synthase [Acidobacteriota bacterium]
MDFVPQRIPAHIREIRADRGDDRVRLDRVLVRRLADLPDLSRARIQGWIRDGRVRINGEVRERSAHRVENRDLLAVAVPTLVLDKPEVLPQPVPLDILHEDEHLIALDKPAGIVVHPTWGHKDQTIVNGLLWHCRDQGIRPSLLHRLDRGTSGVLLAGKSREMFKSWARQLRRRQIRKEYLALVHGVPDVTSGRIDLPIERDPEVPLKMRIGPDGKNSLTLWQLVAAAEDRSLSLLRCRIITGRTHQIRVHLNARGWPIVGDGLYGGDDGWRRLADPAVAEVCRALEFHALHAERMELTHPGSQASLAIVAPVPERIQRLLRLDRLRFGD